MFLLARRTDVIPEMRVLINPQHVVAVLPITGGTKCKLYLDNSETWEIELAFAEAVKFFRETDEAAETPALRRG